MKDGSSDNSSRADLRFDATSIGRSRVGSVLDGLWDTTGFDITGVGVGIGYKKSLEIADEKFSNESNLKHETMLLRS